MFERFTEPSRRVVVLAQEEARMLDHNYIGTEHILLGLIHEGEGVAARAIVSLGLTLEMARDQVREHRSARGSQTPTGHIPFTPRAKKVLELSLREALALKKELHRHRAHPARPGPRGSTGWAPRSWSRPLRCRPSGRRCSSSPPPSRTSRGQTSSWRWSGWRPGCRRAALASGCRPEAVVSVRAQVVSEFRETLASIGETLAALEQRLTGIERRLGITPQAPEEGRAGTGPASAATGGGHSVTGGGRAGTGRSTDAPEGDAPEESAE